MAVDLVLPQRKSRLGAGTLNKTLFAQLHVLQALILQDIKSRFFGNGLGYVATILWPSVHLAAIIIIRHVSGAPTPFGSSSLLYASTAVMPYIAWSYISRFMLFSAIQNKSFLSYPIINSLDLLIARLFMELISTFIIVVLLVAVLATCQVQAVPMHIGTAVAGLLSACLLGAGFGFVFAPLCAIAPLFSVVHGLLLILFWVTCGLAFNPELMPTAIGQKLAWLPLVHSVDWILPQLSRTSAR